MVLLSDALDDNTQQSQQSRDPVVGSSANLQDEDSVGIDGYVYEFSRDSGGGGAGGGNLLTNRGFLPLGRMEIDFHQSGTIRSLIFSQKDQDRFTKLAPLVHNVNRIYHS